MECQDFLNIGGNLGTSCCFQDAVRSLSLWRRLHYWIIYRSNVLSPFQPDSFFLNFFCPTCHLPTTLWALLPHNILYYSRVLLTKLPEVCTNSLWSLSWIAVGNRNLLSVHRKKELSSLSLLFCAKAHFSGPFDVGETEQAVIITIIFLKPVKCEGQNNFIRIFLRWLPMTKCKWTGIIFS